MSHFGKSLSKSHVAWGLLLEESLTGKRACQTIVCHIIDVTIMKNATVLAFVAFWSLTSNLASAQEVNIWASSEKTGFTPNVHHPNIKSITLFAQNPEIVTPVGIAVAPDGRVFVQENHTHKRNSDYEGPETDRILVFEDKDKDGIADDRSVFYEGHKFSTDLLFGPDGHLYVSTRWFIGRFPDAATRAKADGEPEKLIRCETDGDYPHNGVGGLAIDPGKPDWLAFGFGENLGVDYTFVGTDGVKLSGGGEGGSTYRCRTDGSQLTRESTGHWNAFGMAFDLNGNLFSTDNDPNATPPNRLLHIIPGADFGYEYRYGRSGRHPLVCWYGENPGTLGKIGALGEAACGLIPHGPGKLLSASWTDNRVDLHTLTPQGASFAATRKPFLSGPDDFRPVHFAYSADGKYLYFTDWVKLSYPVHGHGRIWRVEFKEPVRLEPSSDRTPMKEPSTVEALANLGSDDPYTRTTAMHVLSKETETLKGYDWQSQPNEIARAHYAVTLKRSSAAGRTEIIPALLADNDSEVRFVGIKWIADEKLGQYESQLSSVLDRSDLSRRDLLSVIAALARISGGSKKEFSPDEALLELALDESKPPALRSLALANVKVNYPRLTTTTLAALVKSKSQSIQREAIQALAIHPDAKRSSVLAKIAEDGTVDAILRADAIAGLAAGEQDHALLLGKLASDSEPMIAKEANRTLVALGLTKRMVAAKPPADRIDDWVELLKREVTGKPDIAVGRRLFFHATLAGCYKCHAIQGRGSAVGPDLTTIHKQTGVNQAWLLKHIVNPNAEMAPYYRPQQLITVNGKVLTGLVVGNEGKKQVYVAADGSTFSVDKEDVEERREVQISIMPNGLLDGLSFDEIRHLIAYLLSDKEQRIEHSTVTDTHSAQPQVIGNPDFIHLENDNGVWWLVDHTGKRFITTGMNHVGEGGVLFNEVNKGWLTGKFGADIKGSWGGLNPRAENHGAYADMVVQDFKSYAFNTIPFHAYSTPLKLYEERGIYYVAKLKVQSISLMQMNREGGARFPDVFSMSFRDKLDDLAKKTCTPLRNAKYCLGYAYFDMPDLKPVRRWQRQLFPDGGLVYPWVQDMRALPATAAGKQEWMRILKRNHESAADAARVYAIDEIDSWDDLAKVTTWPIKPNDVARVRKDADDMLAALAEKWYGLHHELIRKYDPNHLLLGDKHDVGYDKSLEMIPDGVLDAITRYSDVLMIQYYSFYTDLHNATLRKLHSKTGLPIINGDHSYAFKTPKHTKIKGLEVESSEAVASEYRRYMHGIMSDHPYMLGWWNCGYIEQWAPAGTRRLGQQSGFFSPFGEPNAELLSLVKEANENAANWHGDALTNKQPPASKPATNAPAETPAAPKKQDQVIADFESEKFLKGKKTSHNASVTLVDDVPEGGGKFAGRIVVESDAGAKNFFGTGFKIPVTDFSKYGEIRFWIKADFESGFNFQCSSGAGKTSVFPFTTVGSAGKWKLISAPIADFRKPPWAKAVADMKAIHFFQITAFGTPPYDGKTILLDHLVGNPLSRSTGTPARGEMKHDGEESLSDDRVAILQKRAARLREPRIIKRGELVDMFDGKTLNGWFTSPRVYVPRDEKFTKIPSDQLYDEVIKFYTETEGGNRIPNQERVNNRGVWEVKDGAVIGGQEPGSIAGSYLISEKTYGDFELTLEAHPDFPIDTGIMIRAHKLGSVGYQVLIDNRPNGSIGGVYGNSVGSFLAWPFTIDGDEEPGYRIANIHEGVVESNRLRGGQFKSDYSCTFEGFNKVWKPNDWNHIKVRCTGRLPLIETWINGMLVSKVDTATLADVVPNYDAEAIFERIGRKGHIAFEVHDSPTRQRWAPGAKCRWRNVQIRELEIDERKPKNITLSKINGRHWLVGPDGKPFFAHGITHAGNGRAKLDLKKFSAACKAVGFNSYGYGCPDALRSDMPYLESWNHLVPISMYRGDGSHKYCDIFDPVVQTRIERGVKANCEKSKDNPNCIGYAWTDLATWPLKNQLKKSWVDFIRELPEGAPGREAYQKFLSTWEGEDAKARDQEFLKKIAREYFRVIGTANRKYDPDHLIFGDRLSFYTYDEDVLKEMLPWIDAIAFQPHFWRTFPRKQFDEIYEISGKPILLCDFAVRFKDGDKNVQMFNIEEDSFAAGRSYAQYVTAALDSEYIIGVFWCNPVDTPKGFRKAGVKQGFFGDGLSERPGLHEAVRRLNAYRDEITPGSVNE